MNDRDKYLSRVQKERNSFEATVAWHLDISDEISEVEFPWSATETYRNVSVYTTPVDSHESILDPDATLVILKKIMKYAVSKGAKVEKKYDSTDFELKITVPGTDNTDMHKYPVVIHYYTKRDLVCTKKVVGTKHVPEQVIPARDEEIVEWDCEPLSLLK